MCSWNLLSHCQPQLPRFSYWKGVPRQGWLYLSISHLSFHSFILGREVKLRVPWTDVTSLDKSNSLIFPDSIKVSTRQKSVSENFQRPTPAETAASRRL